MKWIKIHLDHFLINPKKRNSEIESELKRIKREKEELEERNLILMNEMRSCVKHFYPTSWKQSDQYSHSRIENWDHQTITKNAQERF